MTTSQELSRSRREWEKQAKSFLGKTIKNIVVNEEWTTFEFTDKSLLSLRDEPE